MPRQPEFWRHRGVAATCLRPIGALVAAVARRRRLARTPWRAPVPVVCVGNLSVGGTGKTPVVQAVTSQLQALGAEPAVLARGYGGSERGPLRVDPTHHVAAEVGDEPLLHASSATTWVGRDRIASAKAALAAGATHLVLDDGFQSAALHPDLALVVVDGAVGFQNGLVLPAGPLREPVAEGLARADALVVIGRDATHVAAHARAGLAVLGADLVPDPTVVDSLRGRPLVAFAGIGRPEKFFATLREAGLEVTATHAFPDHHAFRASEIERLKAEAARHAGVLVTTAKDAARLAPVQRAGIAILPVRLAWRDPSQIAALLASITNRG